MKRLWRRFVFCWRRTEMYRELEEELEVHRAMSREASGAASDREMGNVGLSREESWNLWSFVSLEQWWQDVRYAVRVLRKSPGFTAVAAASLALGIGGNAAVFSLVHALLIRPLPYFQPGRLVRITGIYPKAAYVHFRDHSRTMDVASVSAGSEFSLTGEGEPARLFGSAVSVNFFSVIGTPVELGRSFASGEDRPGTDGVIVLSHALWQTKFNSDPSVIGRVVQLEGVNREVIGVMPAAFQYPSPRVQFWIPARIDPSVMEDYWGTEFTPLIARLRPGVTAAQASGETRSLVAQVRAMFPYPMTRQWNSEVDVIALKDDLVSDARGKLLVLFSAVGIVLLICCTNVASLLLSRAAGRRKEMALRAALGAGRLRIVRQLLTESILLAAMGAALGILLASATVSIFRSVLPADAAALAAEGIDLRVLGFAAALAVLSGLLFGLAPALSASQIDLAGAMKTGSQRASGSGWNRFRNWLTGAEVALSVVLVIAAGLLTRTLYRLSTVDPGFHAARVLTLRISPSEPLCKQRSTCIALYDNLVRRAREIPGVSAAAVASTIPLDGRFAISLIPVDIEDHPKTADFPAPIFLANAVSADYTQIMNILLLSGRPLTDRDAANSSPAMLISAATARRFWPHENALGKHIKPVWFHRWSTVVGITGNIRQYNLANHGPDWIAGTIYMPYAQSVQRDQQLPAAMNLLVRTFEDPARVGSDLRRLAMEQNPNVPVSRVETIDGIAAASLEGERSSTKIFLSFAIAALLLAAVGIYGLVSYSVSQRTYEIGVRMAIGATKNEIIVMILKQSLEIALWGIGAGLAAAFLLTRFLATLLYGVAATDPWTFSGVAVLLAATTTAASGVPAWRASQIDPTRSLRTE